MPSTRRRLVPSALALLLLVALPASAQWQPYSIKNCSPEGTVAIGEAYRFIADNLETILAETTLSARQKRKVRNQWDNVVIKCRDETAMCDGKFGKAHGKLTDAIKVCYERHALGRGFDEEKINECLAGSDPDDCNLGFCELADTIFHESGHTFDIPYGPLFSSHDPGDRIWSMGRAARAECYAQDLDRTLESGYDGPLRGRWEACTAAVECRSYRCQCGRCIVRNTRDLGQQCYSTEECQTGRCSLNILGKCELGPLALGDLGDPGRCVCTEDSQCAAGQYCWEGPVDIGINECRAKLADGAVCTDADHCASGVCNVRCYTPKSKALGQSCNIGDECKKGKCSGTGWGAIPGKCVCASDGDCDSGSYCKKGLADIGTNVCKPKLADGAVCTDADHCAGGACNVRCYSPNSKALGRSCNISAECKKGKCSGTGWGAIPGKCVCDSDNDCGSGSYCKKGLLDIGTNVCKPKLAEGKACSQNHQCKSGCCKIHNFKMQCRPSSKCK